MPSADDRRALQEAIIADAEPVIEKIIAEAMQAASEKFRGAGQVWIPDDHGQRVEGALLSLWRRSVTESGRLLIDEFKGEFPPEAKDDEGFFSRVLRTFIEVFGGQKIRRITETTRANVSEIVINGQSRGATLPEIADAIQEIGPQFARRRALVIARTETHSSSGYASQETAKTSRRPLVKRWVSVEDARTRDFGEGDGVVDEYSHRVMNGVTMPLDQPYSVPQRNGGTASLMFPGDPSGPPGAIISCRCAEVYERAP